MYSGLKYQNFDGNKYLDGDPFMASAIFAQNDDDLKGWSGNGAHQQVLDVCQQAAVRPDAAHAPPLSHLHAH